MVARDCSFRVRFATVNRSDKAGYREGWQRHHALPQQSANDGELGPFLTQLRNAGFHLDDFATNGILLPALPSVSRAAGLPLHSGGHAGYNAQVLNRMRAIRFSCESVSSESARIKHGMIRLRLLQAELLTAIPGRKAATLDHLALAGRTDGDLDDALRRLFVGRASEGVT